MLLPPLEGNGRSGISFDRDPQLLIDPTSFESSVACEEKKSDPISTTAGRGFARLLASDVIIRYATAMRWREEGEELARGLSASGNRSVYYWNHFTRNKVFVASSEKLTRQCGGRRRNPIILSRRHVLTLPRTVKWPRYPATMRSSHSRA